jgi:hypothetical protein
MLAFQHKASSLEVYKHKALLYMLYLPDSGGGGGGGRANAKKML